MSTRFGKKQFFVVSLMLFSMFFGAGNFIFPPMVGMKAGENFYVAIGFFCLTAVALPVLGVAAIARAGTLKELASRADPIFASICIATIYISIGPLVAIPRASNMPFEIGLKHYFDMSDNGFSLPLFIYSFIYFALNYYICLNPSKLVDTLGEYLTPVLLILIVVFFGATFIDLDFHIANASDNYINHPASTAFIAGYQTMDAMAALVFGISVVGALKGFGITKAETISSNTVKAGIFAGAILMVAYMMLGFLGYKLGGLYSDVKNEADLLSSISRHLFGEAGRIILGIATFLACLTTTLGLIGSSSIYFSSVSKIGYKTWVLIWTVSSFIVANFGLTNILKFSIPILIAIYPVAIILIILSFLNNIINSSRLIYRSCVYTAVFVGVVNGFDSGGLPLPFITNFVKKLPLYEFGLGFILPSCIAFIVSYIVFLVASKNSDFDEN